MSIGIGIAIYAALVSFITSILLYYYKVQYPKEEAQLKEKSK